LPSRDQIDPGHFKRHLPTISLIDVARDEAVGRLKYRQRLAGTGLYSVYGREITGRPLEEVYSSQAVHYWALELERVVREKKPCVGFHSLAWRGAPHLSILWLRMPLSSNGVDVDMILGYDALVGVQASSFSGIRAA